MKKLLSLMVSIALLLCALPAFAEEISVTGAGRTDAGVHARMMVAHFDAPELDCEQLAYKLNRLLPQDIAVQRVEAVSDEMHARFSAKN